MNCPQCWQEWVCGCNSCKHRNPGKMRWRFTLDGECEVCPRCGFTAHADFWFAEQFFQLPDGDEMKHDRIHQHQAWHIRQRPMMRPRTIANRGGTNG